MPIAGGIFGLVIMQGGITPQMGVAGKGPSDPILIRILRVECRDDQAHAPEYLPDDRPIDIDDNPSCRPAGTIVHRNRSSTDQ